MPVSGGPADKFGNRYEALWAVDRLLRIVDGTARYLILEPLDPEESRGVEFSVANADGTTEYWSVKRQTTNETGWTLAAMAKKSEQGRSILGDLLGHIESGSTHRAVFASALSAAHFEELRIYSKSKEMLDARLARSEDLQTKFAAYILSLCENDAKRAHRFLSRTRTHAVDEPRLRDDVEFAMRKTFYAVDGSTLDAAAIRGHLADLLLDNMHRPIDRG